MVRTGTGHLRQARTPCVRRLRDEWQANRDFRSGRVPERLAPTGSLWCQVDRPCSSRCARRQISARAAPSSSGGASVFSTTYPSSSHCSSWAGVSGPAERHEECTARAQRSSRWSDWPAGIWRLPPGDSPRRCARRRPRAPDIEQALLAPRRRRDPNPRCATRCSTSRRRLLRLQCTASAAANPPPCVVALRRFIAGRTAPSITHGTPPRRVRPRTPAPLAVHVKRGPAMPFVGRTLARTGAAVGALRAPGRVLRTRTSA